MVDIFENLSPLDEALDPLVISYTKVFMYGLTSGD